MPKPGSRAQPESRGQTAKAAGPSWGPRSAWSAGALLFGFDIAQGVLLTPWLLAWVGAGELSFWLALSSALGLVSVAAASFSPPLVRHIAQTQVAARRSAAAPSNWARLRAQALRFGGVVLLVLGLALAPLLWEALRGRPDRFGAVLLYAVALGFRLRASVSFVLLNGCLQVGRDKWLLAATSGLSLVGVALAAARWHSAWAMAAAVLISSVVLWGLARHAEKSVAAQASDQAAPAADRAEMRKLLALAAAGFVQVGTTVPLATAWLPAGEAVSFGFWFRAAAVASVLAGYYAQVRFPAWALQGDGGRSVRRELAAVQALIAVFVALVAAAVGLCAAWPAIAGLSQLSAATVAALCGAAGLTASSQLLGLHLLARGRSSFVTAAAVIAMAAPVLASALAAAFQPWAFVLGYLLCAVALRALLQWHWQQLRNGESPQMQPAQSPP